MGRDRTGSFKRTDRGLYARVTWIDSHGKRRERQRKTISGTTREARRLISEMLEEIDQQVVTRTIDGDVVERIAYGADNAIVGHKTGSSFVPLKAFRGGPDARLNCRIGVLDARLIGESDLMQALKESIRLVANSAETVLITGESGTGKELIARAVHDLSARHSQPFLAVNCGALTESLLV